MTMSETKVGVPENLRIRVARAAALADLQLKAAKRIVLDENNDAFVDGRIIAAVVQAIAANSLHPDTGFDTWWPDGPTT